MKILTICSAGNSRSVGTRFCLNQLGRKYDVIACGIDVNTPETVELLATWADKILMAELNWLPRLTQQAQDKVDKNFELGSDVWSNPLHPELHEKVRELLKGCGL